MRPRRPERVLWVCNCEVTSMCVDSGDERQEAMREAVTSMGVDSGDDRSKVMCDAGDAGVDDDRSKAMCEAGVEDDREKAMCEAGEAVTSVCVDSGDDRPKAVCPVSEAESSICVEDDRSKALCPVGEAESHVPEPVVKELKPWMCGAKTRSGAPCRAPKIKGRPRCRKHGGVHNIGRPPTHGLSSKRLHLRPSFQKALRAVQEVRETDGLSMVEDIDRLRARLLEIQVEEDKEKRSAYHEAVLAQAIDRLRRTEMTLDGMVEREAAADVLRMMLTVVYRSLIVEVGVEEADRIWTTVRKGLGRAGLGAVRNVADEAAELAGAP